MKFSGDSSGGRIEEGLGNFVKTILDVDPKDVDAFLYKGSVLMDFGFNGLDDDTDRFYKFKTMVENPKHKLHTEHFAGLGKFEQYWPPSVYDDCKELYVAPAQLIFPRHLATQV